MALVTRTAAQLTAFRTALWTPLLVALLLAGCAAPPSSTSPASSRESASPGPASQQPVQQPAESTAPRPREEAPAAIVPQTLPEQPGPVNPAVHSLLLQAHNMALAGDCAQAIAVAERALRIDHRHGPTYLLLAECYHQLGDSRQARDLARQGLQFTRPDSPLGRALRAAAEP